MRILLLVAVALVGLPNAHAKFSSVRDAEVPAVSPSVLQPGAPRGGHVDRMELVLADDPAGVTATWTIALSTTSRTPREITLPIAISHDVRFTGLELALTDADPMRAVYATPREARSLYDAEVFRQQDPALLERVAVTDHTEQLRLRVFPVSAGKPALVTLHVFLPGGNMLRVVPGASAIPELTIRDAMHSATWHPLTRERVWELLAPRGTIGFLDDEQEEHLRALPEDRVTGISSLVATPWTTAAELRFAAAHANASVDTLGSSFHRHVAEVPTPRDATDEAPARPRLAMVR